MRRQAVIVVAGVLVAVMAGCSTSDPVDPPSPSPSSSPTRGPSSVGVPEGFEEFYGQEVDWSSCGEDDDFECATFEAPMDWSDPDSERIDLAVMRLPATGESQGSLLMNPGGPGASGMEFVEGFAGMMDDEIKAAYDLVGWDPRGVGDSSAVECFDDGRKDEEFADDEAATTVEDAVAEQDEFVDACAKNSGELLEFVDTQSSARDMDMLRAALGDDHLTYLGMSYGTRLGATYAGLFPETAGRLVLDAAVDMEGTEDSDQMIVDQLAGFEASLRAYVEDCLAGATCPLTGTVDEGLAQVSALLVGLKAAPLPTDDGERLLTNSLATTGVIQALYAEELWEVLSMGLDQAIHEGDGTMLLLLADFYNGREDDGTYDNSSDAQRAINCLDIPQGAEEDWAERSARMDAKLREVAPTLMGPASEGAEVSVPGCTHWPFPVVEPTFDMSAVGAEPIMVIGTTGDPATPFAWSEALAQTLDSGFLVTREGEGHGSYVSAESSCIDDAVNAFLLEGTVPDEPLTCS